MKNLNEVIRGLECCLSEDMSCAENCPCFKGSYELDGCMDDLLADALEHLKEYAANMAGGRSDTNAEH